MRLVVGCLRQIGELGYSAPHALEKSQMSDIAHVLQRKAELERTVKNAQTELAEIGEFLRLYEKFIEGHGPEKKSSPMAEILDACALILSDMGRPMRPAEILGFMEDMDIQVGGKAPANNLSAMLSNAKDRFRSTESGWVPIQESLGVGAGG